MELTQEQFVVIWQTSQTLPEVCAKTKLESIQASRVAAALRKRGVELKKFYRGVFSNGLQALPQDLEALKKLAVDSLSTNGEKNK